MTERTAVTAFWILFLIGGLVAATVGEWTAMAVYQVGSFYALREMRRP